MRNHFTALTFRPPFVISLALKSLIAVTSLDVDKLNLDQYVHHNVNITGFRLIDPESWPVQQYLKKFPNSGNGKENYLYSANALVHDAVR